MTTNQPRWTSARIERREREFNALTSRGSNQTYYEWWVLLYNAEGERTGRSIHDTRKSARQWCEFLDVPVVS